MKIGLKARSLSSLEKTADKWFSLYIRLRDANENGEVRCVTCGKVAHYKEMDCGHFITRNHKATRFNEKNCSVQCTYCNRYKHGEQYKHGIYLHNKYGEDAIFYLKLLETQSYKRTRTDFEQLIKHYKEKSKQQAERLGIKI